MRQITRPLRGEKRRMNEIRTAVAQNIAALRLKAGLTQLELAEKLNYSDKAVSKWERGESLPDVTVLKTVADLFGVTVDDLLREGGSASPARTTAPEQHWNRRFIAGMCVLTVWLVAMVVYVVLSSVGLEMRYQIAAFYYAVPASVIVWLVLNAVWFNPRRNFLIVSLLMWSTLGALYMTLRLMGLHLWRLFLLGLPGQAIIVLWSFIRRRKKR